MPATQTPPARLVLVTALVMGTAAFGQETTTPATPMAEPPPAPPESANDSFGDAVLDATVGEDERSETGDIARVEPIVVTARKWEEILQNVPMAVTVVDLRDVISAGVADVKDAAGTVPNLFMSEFSARRLSFPFIRGIGSGQGDPAVSTYIDGVPQLSTSSTNIPLLGAESVEFLRGPQGTLYGRNALGGLIHIQTRAPGKKLRLKYQGAFGNYSYEQNAFGIEWGTGPVAIGFDWMKTRRDGYTTNTFTGGDVDSRDSEFWRGQVVLTPTESDELRFSIYDERSRDGGFALFDVNALNVRPHELAQDFNGQADRDIIAPSLTWVHYGESIELTTVSAYNDWDISELSDFDFSVIDGVRRDTTEDQTYFSQEIRIGSAEDAALELGDDFEMRWLLGVQAFNSNSDRAATNDFRPGGAGILFPPAAVGQDRNSGTFSDTGLAAFGQAVFTWDDSIDLTLGLRYDYEDKDADTNHTFTSGGFVVVDERASFTESYDQWLPDFGLAWRPTDDATLYARIARSFKAGGFNLSAPAGSEAFGPETSWTYELGAKTTWADGRVQLNGAFFYIDWDDMQLSQFDAVRGGYVQNAGESRSLGVELEAVFVVTDGLELYSSFGWLDTKIDQYTDPFGTDTSGNDLPFAPETTFSAGARVGGEIGSGWRWYAAAEYINVGKYYFEAGNRLSESYDLANFRAGIRKGRFNVEGWMRNAFDENYITVAFQPSPIDPSSFVGENGAPQIYGVTVGIGF